LTLGLLLVAAAALSAERACYVWIARAPAAFRRWCARPAIARIGEPVAVVRTLFCAFKAVQFSVFVGWCYLYGDGSPGPADHNVLAWGIGSALILIGQVLNVAVFFRLGAVGVFYGDRLGYEVPWCRDFPFSVLAHPQYVGAVLSIWGFFVAMRFPADDWILLPALETVYYTVGTWLEERGGTPLGRRGEDVERLIGSF
jgi:methylene-fatty-acyl-phospholipid synthase